MLSCYLSIRVKRKNSFFHLSKNHFLHYQFNVCVYARARMLAWALMSCSYLWGQKTTLGVVSKNTATFFLDSVSHWPACSLGCADWPAFLVLGLQWCHHSWPGSRHWTQDLCSLHSERLSNATTFPATRFPLWTQFIRELCWREKENQRLRVPGWHESG